ncbi:MAG: helix-turn-helix transcriptional regulator [Chloroflexi bacterium]|nr:helix-turn-helix transcriptional regulator [Chloroflexota bacterium]MBP8057054.1 helix-turn-helix transcriptional regulator [Chloroflexota bacterium]
METNPEKLLPLSTTIFHILLVLADRARHGYSIMKAIDEITNGQVKMGPGTFYGAIKRLLEANLIIESDERPDPELDDERRRYYELTPFGQQVLKAEIVRLSQLIRYAESQRLFGSTL